MDFFIRLYFWGILAELLVHSYALIMYSFGGQERKTYEANLNKVGWSWDPLYLQVYRLSEFKHTTLRFWRIVFLDLLGCVLSWYQVLYRLHKIMKVREINSMLTPEQKQAAFILRNNSELSKEEVIEKLKILDPSYIEPGTIIISKEVDSKEFSRIFAKALLDQTGRKILVPLLEASGNNFTLREMAILKYALGEKDREFLMQVIKQKGADENSYREAEILNRQIKILESVLGKGENKAF